MKDHSRTMLQTGIFCIGMAVLLFLYIGHQNTVTRTFNGDRIGGQDTYILRFDILNREDSHTMSLQAGDELHCSWKIDAGEAKVLIACVDGDEIYRGDKIDSADFTVTATSAGDYTITVTGRQARGMVEVRKIARADQEKKEP